MIRIAEFSKEIGKYFEWMENEINREYKIAEAARKRGLTLSIKLRSLK